jgi:hypothetical protein
MREPFNSKEEDAHEEAGAFVAVDEGMVADEASDVGGRHVYDVGVIAIGMKLLRPGKGGLKQAGIAQSRGTAVQGEKAIVKREDIALLDPEKLTHLRELFRSFGESMQSIAVAANDVLGPLHLLFKRRIVRRELIGALWTFDFADFQFQHVVPPSVITIAATTEEAFKWLARRVSSLRAHL